jgi:protein Tex
LIQKAKSILSFGIFVAFETIRFMNTIHIEKISGELSVNPRQVIATVVLLDEGSTVPFISRYRKEMTGSLDEVAIAYIRDRVEQLRDMDKRRETILKSIEEQGKLTEELRKKIEEAETMSVLEDLYLPYKPKKRTKATIAREKGLEPLAQLIFEQGKIDVMAEAEKYIDKEKDVKSAEEAIQGASDIIAEWINENPEVRAKMRDLFINLGVYRSTVIKGREDEGQKYKDYFDWEEPVKKVPSHRVLAMRRGEKELILSLDCAPPEESAFNLLRDHVIKSGNETSVIVEKAMIDSYKRLLKPSMETEARLYSKKKADEEAINVFTTNLRQLLLSPPLGQKNVMALDPGFRTGCKVVCLDQQGKLIYNTTIYPNEPQLKTQEAMAIVMALCEKYQIEAIAIGNGTASRETEAFIRSIGLPEYIMIVMVNESGASIYSASEAAREEFPDYDLTVRGSVSIGRRLIDPLAELVKIDPKSIGVGQYQHDVDQNSLKKSLDDVVVSCVNNVGVEINTASKQILTYVSGLGPQLAQNIVNYRNENGPFRDRASLKNVPRMGEKAFEQAAGFLRVHKAENPLDESAVHPESYGIVEQMAKDLGCSVHDLMKDEKKRKQIDPKKYVNDKVGLPTLQDILLELEKPGRDPREIYEAFSFNEGVNKMEDLKTGMKLPGIVTNITNFGAFVDIGVHQDGLVHISHISDEYVSNPSEKLSVHQKVEVTILEVDIPRKRISLSMKSDPFAEPQKKDGKKQQSSPPAQKKKSKKEEELDFNAKLAMLKNKFKQ